ncbi:hypothetical protein [Gimesia chilikensis]|uniref:hypothetical protein n=1 Tax=Gimesia chilikensis TaxID=2605989 RepID=UPI00118D5C53|nr:hypothetical protein [Gimesia chilikensis]QDT85600.1 hypothetical protein MalM14_32700 [Gimesia chilikensis]
MTRSADYTIKGFLYQFLKTIREILNSEDESVITVEGIVEDIDIETLQGNVAIQCKYHEANSQFNLSSIYKPLLQMMVHAHENRKVEIKYILYAHFPNHANYELTLSDLEQILTTQNSKLVKLANKIKGKIDLEAFLKKFKLEFGVAFDDLVDEVKSLFEESGVSRSDIETLTYPNALQIIADLSTKHDVSNRKITKLEMLESLGNIRKTAISHWTMSLRSKKQLLDARKKQLKAYLDVNSRLRYFVLDSDSLEDFDSNIVLFISEYLNKYHFKPAHIQTPLFCVRSSKDLFYEILDRLYQKGIIATDGIIGSSFKQEYFFRKPIIQKRNSQIMAKEFSLRLLHWDEANDILKVHQLVNHHKCDDLFILGNIDPSSFDGTDLNLEYFPISSLQEIKYITGLSGSYE